MPRIVRENISSVINSMNYPQSLPKKKKKTKKENKYYPGLLLCLIIQLRQHLLKNWSTSWLLVTPQSNQATTRGSCATPEQA